MRKIKKSKKKTDRPFLCVFRRILRLVYLVISLTLLALIIYGYQSGYFLQKKETFKNNFHKTMQSAGFSVTDIFIDGRVRTPLSDIKKALHIKKRALLKSDIGYLAKISKIFLLAISSEVLSNTATSLARRSSACS